MNPGALRLFRLLGIDVYADWTWALVAFYLFSRSSEKRGLFTGNPHGMGYQAGFILCYMLIVLLHEFGHALACKAVGGRVLRISLTFFGGAAAIQPPQRAAAMLWSIVAGPLVNMALFPLTAIPAYYLYRSGHAGNTAADFLVDVAFLNAWILAFNLLPFYPLDGGQILRSMLWFICGRGLSLLLAAALGILGCIALALGALWMGWIYMGAMVALMGVQCVQSLRLGWTLFKMERLPRHEDANCPDCGLNPPRGPIWMCTCGMKFDTFQSGAVCPACQTAFETTSCPFCHQAAPMERWYATHGFPMVMAPPVDESSPSPAA